MRRRILKLVFITFNFVAIYNCILKSEKESLFKNADNDFYYQIFDKVCVLLDEIFKTLDLILTKKPVEK